MESQCRFILHSNTLIGGAIGLTGASRNRAEELDFLDTGSRDRLLGQNADSGTFSLAKMGQVVKVEEGEQVGASTMETWISLTEEN